MNVKSYKKLIAVLAMAISLCGAANADRDGVVQSTSVVVLSAKIDSYADLDITSKPNKIFKFKIKFVINHILFKKNQFILNCIKIYFL